MQLRFYKILTIALLLPFLSGVALAHPSIKRAAVQKSDPAPEVAPQAIPEMRPIITSYDIYVGGVHLLTADVLFQEQAGHYHAHVQAKTYGFWYRNLPWDTSLDARGRIDNDRFVPVAFDNTNIWKNKTKSTRLAFDATGNPTPSFDPPNTDQNREGVSDEHRRGAYDPVSGLLQMLAQVAINKNCDTTVPVFDGKRRFDISGKDGGSDQVDDDDYGVYKGPARICDASFTMIEGEWKDKDRVGSGFWKRNDKEAGREPFHIWLASVAPGVPELPVQLQSGSLWGLIMVHLSNWHYATADEIKAIN
jgi:hypothetical protein